MRERGGVSEREQDEEEQVTCSRCWVDFFVPLGFFVTFSAIKTAEDVIFAMVLLLH